MATINFFIATQILPRDSRPMWRNVPVVCLSNINIPKVGNYCKQNVNKSSTIKPTPYKTYKCKQRAIIK